MSNSIVREAFEGSVTCVRLPVSCQMSQVSTVPKASSPSSARARAGNLVEDPGDLGAAEVGIDHQAGFLFYELFDPVFFQQRAGLCRAPVLPDDGVVDRLAALPVPEDRRLALVGDADAHQVLHGDVFFSQRLARHVALRAKDLHRIVLDPARLRIDLAELALRHRHRRAFLVEHDRARAGRALVEREDIAHRRILLSLPTSAAEAGSTGRRGP
jgi:hypothetical protein